MENPTRDHYLAESPLTKSGTAPFKDLLVTNKNQSPSPELRLPPSVAESRKCVPYFLMMLSVMALRLGRLPSCLMVCRNSGSSGRAKPLFSCLSRARLFTFQRPNSLPRGGRNTDRTRTSVGGRAAAGSPHAQEVHTKNTKNLQPLGAAGI